MTQSRLAQILAEETPPFRRRATTPMRRRRRASVVAVRKTLRFFAWVVPIVALFWWSMTASEFSIRSIEINGEAEQSRGWVASQLGQLTDQNLLRLELDEVRSTLLRHPWVAEVQLRKELPDRLRVTITEHLPRGVLSLGGEEFLVAADGLVFSRRESAEQSLNSLSASVADNGVERLATTATGGPLLEIQFVTPPGEIGTDSADEPIGRRLPRVAALFSTLEDVTRVSASWPRAPTLAKVLGEGDFEFEYPEGTPAILISSVSAVERASLLERLRPQIDQLYEVSAFDLRFRDRIVLRGVEPIESQSVEGQSVESDTFDMTSSERSLWRGGGAPGTPPTVSTSGHGLWEAAGV